MIKLNLLPEKVRAGELLRLIVILGVGLYILGGLALGFEWTRGRAKVAEAQRQVDAVYAELNSPALINTVHAVEKFTKDKSDEQAKASVVSAYRRDQVTLLRLLDALPDWALGGDVWFNHLSIVAVKKPATPVTLEASAVNLLAFARFYTLLDSQPLLSKLAVTQKAATVVLRGKPVQHFSLSFDLEAPK